MTRDSELHERMVELAKRILEGTRGGTVRWSPTDSESKFLVSGSQSSVMIDALTDRDGDLVATLSILNSRGSIIDSIQSEFEQAEFEENGYKAQPWNKVLEDLYNAARRNAHNVDVVIDSLLSDLDKGALKNPPQVKQANKHNDPWSSSDEPPF